MSDPSSHTPVVIHDLSDLRRTVGNWRKSGERVGLIPTMGALHQGHLELVDRARKHARRTIASIFVNPTQFAPHEDFEQYPRSLDDDCAKLARHGCDAVWAPSAASMYPDGFASRIVMSGPAEGLETDFRPHFFTGVATVCCKLFTQTQPDIAVFGEKDFQQLSVVRRMARDLDLGLEVIGHPTVREADGLALSSRNAYLDDDERALAPHLYAVLQDVAAEVRSGAPIGSSERRALARLIEAGFSSVDYVAVRHSVTLKPIADDDAAARLAGRVLAAVWLGRTRLIDNVAVSSLSND